MKLEGEGRRSSRVSLVICGIMLGGDLIRDRGTEG